MTKEEKRKYHREYLREYRKVPENIEREKLSRKKCNAVKQAKIVAEREAHQATDEYKADEAKRKALQTEKTKKIRREWMAKDRVAHPAKYKEHDYKKYAKKKDKITAMRKLRSHQNKCACVEYLGGKCEICNAVVHPAAFQFHHINPEEKSYAISSKLANGWGVERLEKELLKCQLLCANCHHIVEWEKRGVPVEVNPIKE